MTVVFVAFAAGLYLLAAAAYGAAFVRPALKRTEAAAYALAATAFAVHGIAIAVGCRETGGRHLLSLGGAAGLGGWIAAAVFLVAQRTWRKPAGGVFALPLVLLSVLPGLAGSGAPGRGVPALAGIPAVGVHITTAAAGVALFALACAFGVMYLLQERQLKQKRFGPLLSRLPSLQAMDRVNGWFVGAGFAVFSVAVVTGAVVARTAWCSTSPWDGQQVASFVVWLGFGALVLARRAGSHGRRQAVLTVVAFALAVTCLVGVRQTRTTRHTGFDTAPVAACAGPT